MNRKLLFTILGITVFLGILTTAFFIIGGSPKSSPTITQEQEDSEGCRILQEEGTGKINILFFSDQETSIKYAGILLRTVPFNENSKAFNFYYINDKSFTPKCELYKKVATLCYSKDLIKKAAECPNDIIIVLDDEKDKKIRSSAYLNVVSVNTKDKPEVLVHEIGHVFGQLTEEYITGRNPSLKSKNCPDKCEKFNGLEDGCFPGCSTETRIRSIESGIMRTLNSKRFGSFNEALIRELISKRAKGGTQITGLTIGDRVDICQNQEYLLYDIITEEIEVLSGCPGSNGYGSYSYILKDINGDVIFEGEFGGPLIITDGQQALGDDTLSGEIFKDEEFTTLLVLPSINAAEVIVFDEFDNTIAQTSLNNL